MNVKRSDTPRTSTAKVYDGPLSDWPRSNCIRSLRFREVIGPVLDVQVHYLGWSNFVTLELAPLMVLLLEQEGIECLSTLAQITNYG